MGKAALAPPEAAFKEVARTTESQGVKITGGCHCGSVRFGASVAEPPLAAMHCNCSVCRMTGFIHLIVPPERFHLDVGEDDLTVYRFNTMTAKHK